jgi:hypothetical protein
MGFLSAGLGAELERLPAAGGQGRAAFPASLRLGSAAGLAASRAQAQSKALECGKTAGALRVLAAETEVLGRERIVQPHGLLPRDNWRGVEGALGQVADLDNPQPLVVQDVSPCEFGDAADLPSEVLRHGHRLRR